MCGKAGLARGIQVLRVSLLDSQLNAQDALTVIGTLGAIGISSKASLNDNDLHNLRMSPKWVDSKFSRSFR